MHLQIANMFVEGRSIIKHINSLAPILKDILHTKVLLDCLAIDTEIDRELN